MTAVRATPRRSPGIASLLSGSLDLRSLELVELLEERVDGDPPARDDLRAASPHGSHERRGPPVLVDEDRGRAAGLERRPCFVVVALIENARGRSLELHEIEAAV